MPVGRLAVYRLTPQAEADLGSIWRYTARTWSVDQAEAYVASFESSFRLLLGAPEIARERTAERPPEPAEYSGPVTIRFKDRPRGDELIVFVSNPLKKGSLREELQMERESSFALKRYPTNYHKRQRGHR